jgi:hypothetical protein
LISPAILFAYVVSHHTSMLLATISIGAGGLPFCILIVQFRTATGSHLMSITLALLLYAAIAIGALSALPRALPPKKFFVWVLCTTLTHAAFSIWLVLSQFGEAMRAFDLVIPANATASREWLRVLLEPMLTLSGQTTARLSPVAQWGAMLLNSLLWGTMAAISLRWARYPFVVK